MQNSFYDLVTCLCIERNETISAVAKAIGISSAAASGWKRGKKPTYINIVKLAQHFKVDISVFADYIDAPAEDEKETPADPAIPESRQAFIEKVLSMSDAEFDKLVKLFELWSEGR